MDTPTEKTVKAEQAENDKKAVSLEQARATIEPRRTSRGGVVACAADGDDIDGDDANKDGGAQ